MQNPFSDSFGFKNPILDFLKETHPKQIVTIMYYLKVHSILKEGPICFACLLFVSLICFGAVVADCLVLILL